MEPGSNGPDHAESSPTSAGVGPSTMRAVVKVDLDRGEALSGCLRRCRLPTSTRAPRGWTARSWRTWVTPGSFTQAGGYAFNALYLNAGAGGLTLPDLLAGKYYKGDDQCVRSCRLRFARLDQWSVSPRIAQSPIRARAGGGLRCL